MYPYFNIPFPQLNLSSHAWYYFHSEIFILTNKGPLPAARIHESAQPDWSLSTGEQTPFKQHLTLSDIAMAWPTQPSPISCWHVSEQAKHSTFFFFFMSVIYITKIKEIATRHALALQTWNQKNSSCWGTISAKRTHFTVIKDITICWYYNRDCQGLKWKTWEYFQVLERQIYALHRERRILQKNRKVKK